MQWSNYGGAQGAWPTWKTWRPPQNICFERVQGGL